MFELRLDTHPDLSIQVEHVGAERTPLLIIDNLVDRPDDLVTYAASACTLAPPTDMYPGLRAPAPESYVEVLRKGLTEAINTAYGLPDLDLHSAISYLCVVTTRPEDLKPVQCMPHIDGTAVNSFSTVHYLCSPSYAGTSLYRHRRTGYELVPDFRHDRYRAVLEQELRDFLAPQLSRVKMPRRFEFRAELPREANGKLYKRELRDEFAARAGVEAAA